MIISSESAIVNRQSAEGKRQKENGCKPEYSQKVKGESQKQIQTPKY
jgi:hypothetical protein